MIYQQKMWQSYSVVIVFLALTVYAFIYRLSMPVEKKIPTDQQVSNFEECVVSGGSIEESFPRGCVFGGKTFKEGINYSDAGIEIVPDGVISGTVSIGPFCPVVKEGVECPTPTDAYTSRIARLYDSTGEHVIEWRNISTDGTFEFTPIPGKYFVDVYPGGLGEVPKQEIVVESGNTTEIHIQVDTGIR